ncbi:VOC family protein [Aminobacter sp. AP02]|uniref:VOC family protein n=1 Tax=Aminobacter sp. AP02 TaxID=2135737 RepID=UPI000D798883|nr:VOC family protein [Aminobacter sp. AP02]PWK66379.1 glyoxalase/bleomycin resistance protein/dioxygenase superfamily protein [Aminobacter sp. AP02]
MFTLDHLHCWNREPEAAAQAYVDMFGAERLSASNTANGLRVVIRLAGQLIYVEQAPAGGAEPDRNGLEHFALSTDEFDRAVAELRRKGARFPVEPKQARPGVRVAFVEVPDGGRVEIVERGACE